MAETGAPGHAEAEGTPPVLTEEELKQVLTRATPRLPGRTHVCNAMRMRVQQPSGHVGSFERADFHRPCGALSRRS